MRAVFFLAEAATAHPDGSMSLLKAWIDQVTSSSDPVRLRCALVARIDLERGDAGAHEFKIVGTAPSGKSFLEAAGGFDAVEGKGVMVAVNVQLTLPEAGRSQLALRVDGTELATWPLTVIHKQP